MFTNSNGDAHITVIPYCLYGNEKVRQKIKTQTLCFWFDNTIYHPVNDESIKHFLMHVKMFGASINPDKPESGCFAINAGESLNPVYQSVSEIHYKGQVIYCRS